MQLQMLDVRDNGLSTIIQKNAVNFLVNTVILMWNNPFTDNVQAEFVYPKHIFKKVELNDDPRKIPNPLHMFTPKRPFQYDL